MFVPNHQNTINVGIMQKGASKKEKKMKKKAKIKEKGVALLCM